jgi:hypothetical protein
VGPFSSTRGVDDIVDGGLAGEAGDPGAGPSVTGVEGTVAPGPAPGVPFVAPPSVPQATAAATIAAAPSVAARREPLDDPELCCMSTSTSE